MKLFTIHTFMTRNWEELCNPYQLWADNMDQVAAVIEAEHEKHDEEGKKEFCYRIDEVGIAGQEEPKSRLIAWPELKDGI